MRVDIIVLRVREGVEMTFLFRRLKNILKVIPKNSTTQFLIAVELGLVGLVSIALRDTFLRVC
jgi:hypothetical protein